MIQKWKSIINNWINCYFNDSNKNEQIVSLESLINIISHLRKNFNLDESKSSLLEAHTVEEFISEKYSAFKFENGTVEVTNEEEIYLVASLLLFFVCVNSKDMDIKNAMCSRLSPEDQEIILKFSKSLLECSPVTCRDVQTAISDACGHDMAVVETSAGHTMVAETPPVLRSLHGEVRKLQAALDAERFDRNYLQEELARTNARMEKLLKDKEQNKLDIMNLKAKISMCCGQEDEARGSEDGSDRSAKLTRQLQELEERLVSTQEQLDEVAYERDNYKSKATELKQDRDKWLALSQQESVRASSLGEELETERRTVQSLRELVTELRQHNRLNGLDTSQLECDDTDASIQSLQHNLSVCSEACANVVEVQLGEERAKIVELKQQIQSLQDHINNLNQISESDKHTFEEILSEKENEMFDLKHRINEEIEEKNNLKAYFNDEVSKLNNEINELEQRLKDNNDSSRQMIQQKMQEVKTLQEEKLSLLQSLSDETTKLNHTIQELKTTIEHEKRAKSNMKDSYENHIMKLNEKVLNRNNELVELQNNISEKSEMIESLHMDLRKEKEYIQELSIKYHNDISYINECKRQLEDDLQKKTEETNTMQQNFEQRFAMILTEVDHFKTMATSLQERCQSLDESKEYLQAELDKFIARFDEAEKLMENVKNTFQEEKEKHKHELDEKDASITTLQTHLQDEIRFKVELQNELQQLQADKLILSEELANMNSAMLAVKAQLKEKDRTIEAIDMYLREEKFITEKFKIDNAKLDEQLKQICHDVKKKNHSIELFNNELETTKKSFEDQIRSKEEIFQQMNNKLASEVVEREALLNKISILSDEKTNLEKTLSERYDEITKLQTDCEKLSLIIEDNKEAIQILKEDVAIEKRKSEQLEHNFDSEMTKMFVKLSATEKLIKELSSNSKKALRVKEHEILNLQNEIESLNKVLVANSESVTLLRKEKDALFEKLGDEISYKNKIEKEYLNQCTLLNNITTELRAEISQRSHEISSLKLELESAMKTIQEKCKEIKLLEKSLSQEICSARELIYQKNIEIKELKMQLEEQASLNDELEMELKKAVDGRQMAIESLRKENEQLHFTIEEDNSNHEIIVKEKDKIIDRLEQELKQQSIQLEFIKKDYEDVTLTWENYKMEARENIKAKEVQIIKLKDQVAKLKHDFELDENTKNKLNKINQKLVEEKDEIEQRSRNEILKLMESLELDESKYVAIVKDKCDVERQLSEEKASKDMLETEKVQMSDTIKTLVFEKDELINEKAILQQQILEEKSVRDIVENEKKLAQENLVKEISVAKKLAEEIECLTQLLLEEKSAKEITENEKENIMTEKDLLQQKISELENCIEHLNNKIHEMNEKQATSEEQHKTEKANIIQDLTTEKIAKEKIFKENECLITENETLKHDLIEQTAVQLHKLSIKLNELNEEYSSKINDKQIKLDKVVADMKHLQINCKNQEELNKQISIILRAGLDKLVQDIKKDEVITNELLEQLFAIESYDIPISDKCDVLIHIANTLRNELALAITDNLEKAHEITVLREIKDVIKQKEMQVLELKTEVKRLQQVANENKSELSKQSETYKTYINNNIKDLEALQHENQSLTNDLNDVKVQLEIKVHSLKEKLIDNENLTDKLKRTYEVQIDNLNMMITKLTSYLKDKTIEIEAARKENEKLRQAIEENSKAIKHLEDELKSVKQNEDKLISDFDSERQVLKNMVTVTESVMEDQKVMLNKVISEHLKAKEILQEENRTMKELVDNERNNLELKLTEKQNAFDSVFKELAEVRLKNEKIIKGTEIEKESYNEEISILKDELNNKLTKIDKLEIENEYLVTDLKKCKDDIEKLETQIDELKIKKQDTENTIQKDLLDLKEELDKQIKCNERLKCDSKEKTQNNLELQEKIKLIHEEIDLLGKEKNGLEEAKRELTATINEIQTKLDSNISKENDEITKLKKDNTNLVNVAEENKTVITNLELLIKQNQQLRDDTCNEQINLENKCSLLLDNQTKAEKELEEKQKEILSLQKEIKTLQSRVEVCEEDLKAKDGCISKVSKDKDAVISTISRELLEEKAINEKYQKESVVKTATICELRKNLDDFYNKREALEILKKENEELIKAIGQRETFAVEEKMSSQKQSSHAEKELHDLHHQVDNTSSDITHSSLESLKTISDLEKIIHDKNRKITTLQIDVTYLKSLMAESETKLLDVTKELEVSTETCQHFSCQLKNIVHQKNEEIAELKKQMTKMSVAENRATQIIKVSAKYQAIILKRIAEIKSNTVLKELTNFGNSNNCDNELRRSLNSGSITMEDLENFLETTDRHLKRCSDKQIALQKERDRMTEVNRINESEIINLQKFLTELSVSYQTFSSVKDLYAQKLSMVISTQRTVRREILNLDGRITDSCMCKLERGYAAVMQDLSECAMNLQRWVERCIGRTISPEKIKQAFMTDVERTSLAPNSFQNAGLEVQLEELEKSFQKLLEEVARALKGDGAKDAQAVTVMEVRAEYEDKLNRMKAKMKQLYTEQIAVFKEKQRDEVAMLERELQKARDKMAESSKAYEEHIRGLTTELWSVGEKFLMKKDEAEWLRRKQRSGSLMSLQHVHSSGLVPPQEEPCRPSDTQSLRSLHVNNNNTSKREGRGLLMSDEEGEVFDNRFLKELSATPRREPPPGQRLSELQWRNSLCLPHLKSSYPAELQFAPAIDEEDVKCVGTVGVSGVRQQRKEVGIIAYKKPGPPTPSKQAGRLSATDSELRESLRAEADPQGARKTSTPSRIRALFRSSRNDPAEVGTPRSRRLSNIFRKK